MNNLLQLSKKDTQKLEQTSQCLDSVTTPHWETLVSLMKVSLAFHHWKLVHNEKSENTYTEWKTLGKVLGFKYNYVKTYSARNAVWGLCLESNPDAKFLVYWSNEGLRVQYEKGMPLGNYEAIIEALSQILVNGKTDVEVMEKYVRRTHAN